jgi:hypothetical protein
MSGQVTVELLKGFLEAFNRQVAEQSQHSDDSSRPAFALSGRRLNRLVKRKGGMHVHGDCGRKHSWPPPEVFFFAGDHPLVFCNSLNLSLQWSCAGRSSQTCAD